MQITINIPEEQLRKLDQLSKDRQISRDEIIHAAILTYLQSQSAALDDAFGLWDGSQGDGLDYQRRLRSEW